MTAATRDVGWAVPAFTGAVVGLVPKAPWFNRGLTPGLLPGTGAISAVLTFGPGAHG
ncbi:hypothetical protein [Streptomyces sp. NPDC001714]|uniref:hypothetical protein n=1 Tax=Streptomyces sp. NPDC001714 TaxID=3364603 RepID=UPI0036BF1D59